MATVSYTPSQQAAAEQLVASPERWTAARRKRDGKPFFIVRGRTATYYTASGACTCRGFAARGCCSHELAATMRDAQQAARENPCEMPVTVRTIRPTRYDDLFPEQD